MEPQRLPTHKDIRAAYRQVEEALIKLFDHLILVTVYLFERVR